jgi:hypothetical protein
MPLCSRREFLKAFSASAATSASSFGWSFPISVARTASVISDVPLAKSAFFFLPLTSVKPRGWLRKQLEIQAGGLSGHLDEFWPDVGPNSGWLGGSGESWERGPYFLDGLVPLAHLLENQSLLKKSNQWVNWTIEHQQANGMIAPRTNDDWWPRMVMLKVLTQHQEATKDTRVIPLLERYFDYQLQALPQRPLRDWGKYRWQDELLTVAWLCGRSPKPQLFQLADLLRRQGHNWKQQFANFEYTQKTNATELGLGAGSPLTERAMQTHGVNNAMALKTSAVWWLFSRCQADRDGVAHQLSSLDQYHGLPNGIFSADEHLAGKNPSQGTELCTIVEMMFSLECAIGILGEPTLADRLEKIAFNSLPAALTDDMWAHQYDQQPNQIECSLRVRPWTTNGPESNLFGLEPNFGCCTANMHQGWPKLTSHLWMGRPGGGLTAVIYAPCEVTTKIHDVSVTIVEETAYPFSGEVTLEIRPQRALQFPLSLRIPGWAHGAVISVNGRQGKSARPASYFTINREWKSGDRVEIQFPMNTSVSRSYRNSVVVERGPLVFALNLLPEWRKLRSRGMTADWEAYPTSPWNYALAINERSAAPVVKVREIEPERGVFTLEGAPVSVEVQGQRVSEWTASEGCAGELPTGQMSGGGPREMLALVPYGAAKLRITAFPELR